MTTTQIAGLKVGDIIPAPMPFTGAVQIIGFRYRTSRHTGATYMVADYTGTRPDGTTFQSFDDVAKLANHVQSAEAIANARLIAAAPELLAALTQAVEESGYALSGPADYRAAEHGEPQWVCNARAAIAKAEGTP